ncbi:MAG: winged helix-turn-helix domain-containing protein [Bacteroidetes bacterium]|jgi:DNA-binding winged helix-turn-helix (wHTH) protein|nr:winged helix-turn-helix domain-containing protein [Bacteroidota bacterium]MDF1867805.1 winged helix-turn-helix domain-containing protein [Saprospiraceae bacterium]
MTIRHFISAFQKFLFIIFIITFSVIAYSNTEEDISEKRIGVSMRMIGHELLKCWGDIESRVLPIEKIDGQYKISFESEFGTDPDDLASIINAVITKTKIATHYFVVVEQCETKDVVHSFEIRNAVYPEPIACVGRSLPKDCYNLLITIFENTNSVNHLLEHSSLIASKTDHDTPLKSSLLMIPLLFLIGFIGYFIKKKNPADIDPNLILIGASQFDKKNSTLSYKDKTVGLSHKEAKLLSLLHTAPNVPIEREVILQRVWGDDGDYIGRTLDVFISKLRKKLEADASVKIVNIRGVGYKLVMEVARIR